jgi:ubiquinol-cytochrome c reductase cytochrome b subunit
MEHSSLPSSQPTVIEKVIAFVDERVGLKQMQAKMLNEPVPGGSRWAYVFGSVLLFIFIMQAVTGILLMFYYVPTADHAYASTQYIIHDVDYGWFLLSYHFWGSTAMVVCVFAHMSQVFLWGAYKPPREMIWLVGLALFGIVMGFGFTGYLLPWDQRAYWATTVGVEIMDKTPLLGDFMARFLKGGPTPGQMTLSRFFVIHVMICSCSVRPAPPVRSEARRRKSRPKPTSFSRAKSGKTSSAWRWCSPASSRWLSGSRWCCSKKRRPTPAITIRSPNGIFSSCFSSCG